MSYRNRDRRRGERFAADQANAVRGHPGAAVQKGHANHPVGMLVNNQEIERRREPTEKGQCDMMEVTRAQEVHFGNGINATGQYVQ